ncbi:MAG TPA: DUF2802 domain-containing protein [Zoogloea sp.]|uniref:DUF2802 domain-containing protein n=1 Tax=Zoogloea sp. TaxID=49181 RepID=UPI002CF35523|nr:DUF2802 domain-containing protein [Zoogloea sp.]HMV16741.1 DUF2802 domain-containing protein [Rhodocyclaceae bacterium]HMV63000.1 DUF2802 domain-containing protein [Rhodocyclaceae bacterium]HMZ75325.1 DUF2802 domain-containing protein [Rhodocyclaceae bacterium]HNA67524.1 DUF2802 domain-containing protein [Rhodocyclaceae bacterium]HNF60854.1 DUF2802 domain-containing protein [Rhodocyclaceae bacterium]
MIEIGVREGIWIAIGVLTLYLAFVLIRLALHRARPLAEEPQTLVVDAEAPAPQGVAPAALTPSGEDVASIRTPAPTEDADVGDIEPLDDYADPRTGRGESSAGEQPDSLPTFDLIEFFQLEVQQLRRDVAQLRGEQDQLRREIASVRRDLDEIQVADGRSHFVRPVSPQHSEAMVLAERGMTAAQIADRCGIAVAEAELVCALARREVHE